ncbi:10158_t:CDS:2 [Entrophospora sp. SA101]|nr:10158_t:CDS:2 [Entrophospora sp. SA101]
MAYCSLCVSAIINDYDTLSTSLSSSLQLTTSLSLSSTSSSHTSKLSSTSSMLSSSNMKFMTNPKLSLGLTDDRAHGFLENLMEKHQKQVPLTPDEHERLESMDLNYVRYIVSFFKVHVCDYHSQPKAVKKVNREALITVWGPNISLYDSIHEGQRSQIYSLSVASHQPYYSRLSPRFPLSLASRGEHDVISITLAIGKPKKDTMWNYYRGTTCNGYEYKWTTCAYAKSMLES